MKSTDTPLFTNSCGRIFPEKIQLASYKGEATIKIKEISSLSFKTRITRNGFLFSLLPSIFVGISFFTQSAAEKMSFLAAGILGIALLLYKAERKHILRVYFKRGRHRDISVWSANIKEARKYVNEANKVVASSLKKETPDTAATRGVNILTASA
jgi:hypothetical protein